MLVMSIFGDDAHFDDGVLWQCWVTKMFDTNQCMWIGCEYAPDPFNLFYYRLLYTTG